MRTNHLNNKLISMALVLGMVSGCQTSEESAKEREKFGIELFEKGEYAEAKLEFKSALKEDTTLANTYYHLALIHEKNKNYRVMLRNLVPAIKFDPTNIAARMKLGRLYLLFNELDLAVAEVDNILQQSADNMEALTLRAAILVKQKKQDAAIAVLDDILQKQPDYIEAISLKALILMQNEQFDSALSLITPSIDAGVDDVSIHILKIQLDAKNKDINVVIEDYERLVKLYPDRKEFKIAVAKIYAQANRKQDAEDILRALIDKEPSEMKSKLVLLDFLNSLAKEKAITQLKEYQRLSKDQPDDLFQLSQWLLKNRYLSEAQSSLATINNIENSTELSKKVKFLLANLAFYNKDFEKSASLIQELLAADSENLPAKMLEAKIYIVQEKHGEAEQLLTAILWSNPNADDAIILLAKIELEKGDPKKADKRFREALEVNPANTQALTAVINRALRDKNIDYASELMANALRLQPSNIALLKEAVEIKILSRDWEGAKEMLESIERYSKNNLLVTFLNAKIDQSKGNYQQAITGFKQILAIAPNYPEVLGKMATCYENLQQRPKMIAFIKTFLAEHPKNTPALLIMGQLSLLEKNISQAIASYQQGVAINNKAIQFYAALANIYNGQNKPEKAIDIYLQGLDKNPNNIRLSIYLASTYEKEKRYDEAINVYKSLLVANPKLDVATNNYASILIDIFATEQSIKEARTLVTKFKRSENPYYLDTYAWIELKSGNIDEAVTLLKRVNELADLPVFKYHLGMAYHQQDNNARAVSQLGQAVEAGKRQGGFIGIEKAKSTLSKLSNAIN